MPFVHTPSASTEADTPAAYPRDLIGYGRNPPHARWPGKARIALQFVLNYEEGAENSVLHGDARLARPVCVRRVAAVADQVARIGGGSVVNGGRWRMDKWHGDC